MHETPQSKDQQHPAVYAVGGFLIGAVLTTAWFLEARLPRGTEPVSTPTTSSSSVSSTSANENSSIISVHDQRAGSTVVVDSVDVPAPGVWVAIEELHDGQLGNVLGAARTLGPTNGIIVHLLRPTVPGATYAVVLYRDNGDGQFSQTSDSLYVDFTSGQRVVALFQTSL